MTEISVIMPLFNSEEHLAETLESYRTNAFPGVEIVVVDDGCTDGSIGILQDRVPGCRLLHQKNGGPARARNLALQHAAGTYIAFLDSDDLWPEGTLRRLHQAITSHDAHIAQGKVETFATGEVAASIQHRMKPEPQYGLNLGAALWRRADLDRMNGFDEALRFGEDTDLWFRCWEEGLSKALVPEVTLRYRLHQTNMTTEARSDALDLLPILKRHRDRMRGKPPQPSEGLAEYLGWVQPGGNPATS